jgi:hypothetical protein
MNLRRFAPECTTVTNIEKHRFYDLAEELRAAFKQDSVLVQTNDDNQTSFISAKKIQFLDQYGEPLTK